MASVRLVHITSVPQTLSFLSGQVGYMKSKGIDVHAISSPGRESRRSAREREWRSTPWRCPGVLRP